MAILPSLALLDVFLAGLRADPLYLPISEAENPCHFRYKGREFYAYIKNLSPAYFKPGEDNVWRVQLTDVKPLENIKNSQATFVLIGYDPANNVFATWNPYITKQRIGTALSPSFYSRLSEQVKAGAKADTYTKLYLNNDHEVLIFHADYLTQYLAYVDFFFDEPAHARSPKADETFRAFFDKKEIERLSPKLGIKNVAPDVIAQFVREGCIKYKNFFLAHEDAKGYARAVSAILDFIGQGEQGFTDDVRCLVVYVLSLELEAKRAEMDALVDWEAGNVDKDGKLFRITHPRLVEQLREYMYDQDFQRPLPALNIAKAFYADRFPNMEFADWFKAIDNIVWDPEEALRISRGKRPKATTKSTGSTRTAVREKIVVTMPTGAVIDYNNVAQTFAEVIRRAGPERVRALNLQCCRRNLVTYANETPSLPCYKSVGSGYYVNTHSGTEEKLRLLRLINDRLGLRLTIERR